MITILHGDDIAASRKAFLDEPGEILDGESITITDLTQHLSSGSLFESVQRIKIEKLLSKRKKSAEKEAILTFIDSMQKEYDIVLWEGKELQRSAFTSFTNPSLKLFKLPQVLFTFVDSIRPGNDKLTPLFHQALVTAEVEVIFSMIVRQIRFLLAIKENAQIEETKRLQDWQKNKFISQARLFTRDDLVTLHSQLAKIDHDQKTGGTSVSLAHSIDFFLLALYHRV